MTRDRATPPAGRVDDQYCERCGSPAGPVANLSRMGLTTCRACGIHACQRCWARSVGWCPACGVSMVATPLVRSLPTDLGRAAGIVDAASPAPNLGTNRPSVRSGPPDRLRRGRHGARAGGNGLRVRLRSTVRAVERRRRGDRDARAVRTRGRRVRLAGRDRVEPVRSRPTRTGAGTTPGSRSTPVPGRGAVTPPRNATPKPGATPRTPTRTTAPTPRPTPRPTPQVHARSDALLRDGAESRSDSGGARPTSCGAGRGSPAPSPRSMATGTT